MEDDILITAKDNAEIRKEFGTNYTNSNSHIKKLNHKPHKIYHRNSPRQPNPVARHAHLGIADDNKTVKLYQNTINYQPDNPYDYSDEEPNTGT